VESPSGRAKQGNNGSRMPYIRAQSAGSWISPTEQSPEQRTSGLSIYSFKRRCPGEPSDYEQQLTESPSDREPHNQPASIRPDEAFNRRCPGEAQRFSRFRNGDCPRPLGAEATIHPDSPLAR